MASVVETLISVELALVGESRRLEESECGDNDIAVDELVSIGDGGAECWNFSRSGVASCWGCEVAGVVDRVVKSGIEGDDGRAIGDGGESGESMSGDGGEWDACIIGRSFELIISARLYGLETAAVCGARDG